MSNDKKLTIAIPTFDREVFLHEALVSIDGQIFKEFEIILFDNASPYDIERLIKLFPKLSIKLVKHASNIGAQANLEFALAYNYDTPYVMLFHDDDTIHPKYLEDAIKVLEENPRLMWLGSLVNYVSNYKKMLFLKDISALPVIKTYRQGELADALINNLPLGFSSVIYNRQTLNHIRPDADRFYIWCDRPFLLETCGENMIAVIHYPYINYRIHAAQDSALLYREHITEMIRLIEYFCHIATPGKRGRIFATASAIKTAAVNASSVKDFFFILQTFQDRGLYSIKYLRPYSLMWLGWLLWKRARYSLLKR